MTSVLIIAAAYVVGMFPSAILVARAASVDITSVGSETQAQRTSLETSAGNVVPGSLCSTRQKVQPQWELASQSMIGHSPILQVRRQFSDIAIRLLEASTAEKVSQQVVAHLQC